MKNSSIIRPTTGFLPDFLRTFSGHWSEKFEQGPEKIRRIIEFDLKWKGAFWGLQKTNGMDFLLSINRGCSQKDSIT